MARPKQLFAFGLTLALSTAAIAVHAKKRQVLFNETGAAIVTPASYRSDWSKVTDCDKFRRGLWNLPQADRLLENVAQSGLAVRTELDSKAALQQRVTRDLAPLIDPNRVYLIQSLADWSQYDPEKQELTVSFPYYAQSGTIPVGFNIKSRTTYGSTYQGANSFGVTKSVRRQQRLDLSAEYTFPSAVTRQRIKLLLSPENAIRFKAGGGMVHILGEITETSTIKGRSTPTINRPTDTNFSSYTITMKPRCAYITLGINLVESWEYDDW